MTATTIRTIVRPGGLIQITLPEWAEGQTVDVTVTVTEPVPTPLTRQNLLQWLDSLPRSTKTAEEWEQLEREFQEERNSWDR